MNANAMRHVSSSNVNLVGLSKDDYKGNPTTLCAGCGHNSISNQIISACYELNIRPSEIVKFSGIGCSSKSPAYFLNKSFGFNTLHGRMPSLATGAMFGDTSLKAFGVSGDGDTASIGMGQFKHMIRRNPNLLYIVENNGVYGLTKGQFSATAERGLFLKHEGTNPYIPIDIVREALASNASFVARSFAGDPKQVKELIKAGLSHSGLAVLDIISPCVSFNNTDESHHSYTWGKEHEEILHDLSFIPVFDEIQLMEEFSEGEVRSISLHDGSRLILKKLDRDYDPTNRLDALKILEEADKNNWLVTGLVYINPDLPVLTDLYSLVDSPLNRLPNSKLRPSRESLDKVNQMMF